MNHKFTEFLTLFSDALAVLLSVLAVIIMVLLTGPVASGIKVVP